MAEPAAAEQPEAASERAEPEEPGSPERPGLTEVVWETPDRVRVAGRAFEAVRAGFSLEHALVCGEACSRAFKNADVTWDDEAMDAWLKVPKKFIKGATPAS